MIRKIKKYISEILILLGVWIIAYAYFVYSSPYFVIGFDNTEEEMIFCGIVLSSLGIILFIRKYFIKNEKNRKQ
jgi:hypothetical protein